MSTKKKRKHKSTKAGLPSIRKEWVRIEFQALKSEKAALLAARARLGMSMSEVIRRAIIKEFLMPEGQPVIPEDSR